eukprot:4320416-Heterocapsa_arctica.AAC.1
MVIQLQDNIDQQHLMSQEDTYCIEERENHIIKAQLDNVQKTNLPHVKDSEQIVDSTTMDKQQYCTQVDPTSKVTGYTKCNIDHDIAFKSGNHQST